MKNYSSFLYYDADNKIAEDYGEAATNDQILEQEEIANILLEEIGVEMNCITLEEIPLCGNDQVVIRYKMGDLRYSMLAYISDDEEKVIVQLFIENDYPDDYCIPAGESEIGTRLISLEI